MIGVAPSPGKNPLYSPEGIILVLGIQYAPLVFLTLRAGLRALPRELIEAGLAGGAGPLTVLRTVVLPGVWSAMFGDIFIRRGLASVM